MKLIAWILVIWVLILFIYSKKVGETIDWSIWKQEFNNHPVIFGIVAIVIVLVLLKILF